MSEHLDHVYHVLGGEVELYGYNLKPWGRELTTSQTINLRDWCAVHRPTWFYGEEPLTTRVDLQP